MATTKLVALLICALGTSSAFAQIDPEKHGVFRIYGPKGGQGSCFVVAEPKDGIKLLATAAHIVQTDDGIGNPKKGTRWGGRVFSLKSDFMETVEGAECVGQDDEADIAIVAVAMERDFTILPLVDLTTVNPAIGRPPTPNYFPSGKMVHFFGYAYGKWTETKGYLAYIKPNYVYADAVTIPGQSGSPMVMDGKVCGVTSGGSEWHGYTDAEGKKKNVTWPARAGSGNRLIANVEFTIARYKSGELK